MMNVSDIHCLKDLREHHIICPYITVLNTLNFNPLLKANPQQSRMSASFVSFERCLEVTDFKKFDTANVLPKSMALFLHFLKRMKSRHFSESPQIHVNLYPKSMSANTDSVGFQHVCNIHVWAYLKKKT